MASREQPTECCTSNESVLKRSVSARLITIAHQNHVPPRPGGIGPKGAQRCGGIKGAPLSYAPETLSGPLVAAKGDHILLAGAHLAVDLKASGHEQPIPPRPGLLMQSRGDKFRRAAGRGLDE